MLGKHKKSEEIANTGGFTYPMPSPVKPSALLLPPSVVARSKAKTATKLMSFVVVAAVVAAVATSVTFTFIERGSADDLLVATQEKNKFSSELAQLLPVATKSNELAARKSALAAELAADISYAQIVGAVYAAVPQGVAVSSLDFANGRPCAGPDPFVAGAALGCITINATTSPSTPETIGSFVGNLNAQSDAFEQEQANSETPIDPATASAEDLASLPLLSDAFADSFSSSGGSELQFKVTVNYSLAALSQRFDLGAPTVPPTTGGQ